ncbi:MAG: nicotinate phosphoribosyltransferase [Desulfurococcales archaeon]|nr:nicotinate phosphoribosyltransferase [Desulfurococcales archaeon]
MAKPRVYSATIDEIIGGEATDIYFARTAEILERAGLADVKVRMELHVYSMPKGYEWAVYAGLEEALAILEGKDVDVYSIPEGTIFKRKQPLMIIEGRYRDFAELETAILGALRFSTSIATKAARIKKLAGDKTVLYFGLRALHPSVQPAADRAAYIGGVDGVSGVLAKKYIGVEPRGTMPHALIIVFGDQREAWTWFYKLYGDRIPVIALTDTFFDERIEALMAAETLGDKLYGVRLDTPSSRRGKMRDIVEEVRWALDINGYKNVKIFVSGGIDEEEIEQLKDLVDGFGVGTSISAAPNIDISMDIVEVERDGEWVRVAKRGKLPGAKKLYRCSLNEDYIVLFGEEPPLCGNGLKPRELTVKYMEGGRLIRDLPSVNDIREYVLDQLANVHLLE